MEDKNKITVYDKINISKKALSVTIGVLCLMLVGLIICAV